MNSINLRFFIALLLSLVLTIIPLPHLLANFRPPWVMLLVLYLQFFLPGLFSISLVVILGLILDVLLSTVLGEHIFALSLVCWIASNKSRRFSLFSMEQQMALIGAFALLYELLILITDACFGYRVGFILPLTGTALVSVLLWPWIRLLADDRLLVRVVYRR